MAKKEISISKKNDTWIAKLIYTNEKNESDVKITLEADSYTRILFEIADKKLVDIINNN